MKVLVTGAKGQLGRALQACSPVEAKIHAIDIDECDLTDAAAIKELVAEVTPEVVINAAAYTAVDNAEKDEAKAYAINAGAVAALAEAHAGKLVHVSTDFVFDGTSSRAYRPGDERNPLSAYGRTKAAGEDYQREGDILVRTSWVYTAGGANFVRTMLRLMAEKPALNVVADQIGAPTWAPRLAATIWGLIGKDASGTFHHSDAGVASWYDFAVAIQEEALELGLLNAAIPITPIPTSAYPTPARRPAFSLLDCSATRELLDDGYTHWRTNLRLMLEEEARLG
ncbi:dTDP-4-dehydrorhamnose reductase [Aurantiacibacter sp. MUD11]|uniref:dTDP-4-dehydrorhamnose reductase n=1 Tax=Aurantiacibacter sp. MUD11 TaxID=3003265 RepID=UPI0022AA7AF9|nr:dTDP-4-dehydrorhamnose reductase [Aurantiacibacter sp. MUD11]WAT17031.1 dTDP-4-dehydrorhamnose reductase [Aurantiacibacter sp. MUD11]